MSFFFIALFDDLFDLECPISNKEPQNEEVIPENSIFRVGYSAVQIIFVLLTAGKLNNNYSHAWMYSTPVSPLKVGSSGSDFLHKKKRVDSAGKRISIL
jgi:hypothetical protein